MRVQLINENPRNEKTEDIDPRKDEIRIKRGNLSKKQSKEPRGI
jgi:hypothetical protein